MKAIHPRNAYLRDMHQRVLFLAVAYTSMPRIESEMHFG